MQSKRFPLARVFPELQPQIAIKVLQVVGSDAAQADDRRRFGFRHRATKVEQEIVMSNWTHLQ